MQDGVPCQGGDHSASREGDAQSPWGGLARWKGRRLGRGAESTGRTHTRICVAAEFEAEVVRDGGRGGKAGRSHAVEASEWLFKTRGLHPVGFEQIFASCS